jgi:hypothetical protein
MFCIVEFSVMDIGAAIPQQPDLSIAETVYKMHADILFFIGKHVRHFDSDRNAVQHSCSSLGSVRYKKKKVKLPL